MEWLKKKLDLQYPQTTPFPDDGLWKHFTIATVGIMTTALAFVTVLSAAAVGYELEPYYSRDFNPNFYLWWSVLSSTAIVKGRAGCDSEVLSLRETFTTRLNLFQYTVDSIAFKWDTTNQMPPTSFPYNGTVLENCTFQRMSLTIVQPLTTTTLAGHVTCSTGAVQVDISTSLVMTFEREKDTIFSRFLSQQNTFTQKLYSDSIASPVLLTLMGLSVDVLNVFYFIPPGETAATRPTTRYMSYRYEPRDNTTFDWTPESRFRAYDSGAIEPIMLESGTSLTIIGNLFQVFSAAVLVDLGVNGTTFHNFDQFRQVLSPRFNDSEARPADLRIGWPPAQGLPQYNAPFVPQLLANSSALGINLPVQYVGGQVIDVNFFCRRWRRKSITSFLGAVAAASISFIMAIWGGYMFAAAWLAKKRENKDANEDGEKGKSGWLKILTCRGRAADKSASPALP